MEKIKKFMCLPIAYHVALFITMAALNIMKSGAMGFIFLFEICGVIISPVFYAVLSMCNAVLYGGKVYDLFSKGTIYLLVIGAVRVVCYALLAPNTVPFAVGSAVVAIAIFFLWSALFALTDKMLKKRPGRNKKYRK